MSATEVLSALDRIHGTVSVIGSMNADYTVTAQRLPGPGETITGGPLQLLPGGKSGNQAAAAARIGATVQMFGAVGSDSNADFLLGALGEAGVNTTHVRRVLGPSGTTVITVDATGENTIVYSPGSNYLRPLYDALYDLMGYEKVQKAFERNVLEIAPLAFMRGRTLNNAFVILDEAQNTTPEQMKMFLTRIGFGAKAVITGDVSQIDLPKGTASGLIDAERVLRRVRGIAISHFGSQDVVRHPLVARIIDAYDAQVRA